MYICYTIWKFPLHLLCFNPEIDYFSDFSHIFVFLIALSNKPAIYKTTIYEAEDIVLFAAFARINTLKISQIPTLTWEANFCSTYICLLPCHQLFHICEVYSIQISINK